MWQKSVRARRFVEAIGVEFVYVSVLQLKGYSKNESIVYLAVMRRSHILWLFSKYKLCMTINRIWNKPDMDLFRKLDPVSFLNPECYSTQRFLWKRLKRWRIQATLAIHLGVGLMLTHRKFKVSSQEENFPAGVYQANFLLLWYNNLTTGSHSGAISQSNLVGVICNFSELLKSFQDWCVFSASCTLFGPQPVTVATLKVMFKVNNVVSSEN